MTRYDIPGFSRYYVETRPFRVVNRARGRALTIFRPTNRGYGRVAMVNDVGHQRHRSVVHIAALAFHGQQPAGYVAFHYGGPVTPKTVKWLPKDEAQRLWNEKKISRWQAKGIAERYFRTDLTQRDLAERHGVSQSAISYHIKKVYEETKS